MLKNLVKGMVIGGAALTIAASGAQAASTRYDINIYGASAQFTFWTEAAPDFMKFKLGCADADNITARGSKKGTIVDRDTGITACVGGVAVDGRTGAGFGTEGDTLVMRYTAKASYDGIRAVQKDPVIGNADIPEPDKTDCSVSGVAQKGVRKMASEAGASWYTYPNRETAFGDKDGVAALECLPVTVGASDVAAKTFRQSSTGQEDGPDGGSVVTRFIEYGTNLTDPAENGYTPAQPIVVPFAFYRHPGVPFTNMTRLMATSLFSGSVKDWRDFDPSIASLPTTICLRHAGSGTHATLDAAIMRGDATLVNLEAHPTLTNPDAYLEWINQGSGMQIYFNDGSSDEVKCVGTQAGGVGYADTDKCGDEGVCGDGALRMTYQGVDGTAGNIRNGLYEFWAAQYLYYDADVNNDPAANLVGQLIDFTADGTKIPESKQAYWASYADMDWTKLNDNAWPIHTKVNNNN